jgi:hypothetical protein
MKINLHGRGVVKKLTGKSDPQPRVTEDWGSWVAGG